MERAERCCEDQQVHTDNWDEKVSNGTFKDWGSRTTPDTLFPDCLLTPGDISSLHAVWPQPPGSGYSVWTTCNCWFWPLLIYENRTSHLKPGGSSPSPSGRNAVDAWDTVHCFRRTVKFQVPRVYYLYSLSRRQIQILSPRVRSRVPSTAEREPWLLPLTASQHGDGGFKNSGIQGDEIRPQIPVRAQHSL